MKKFIKSMLYTFTALNLALIVWLTASIIDVATDNLTANPQHHNWNAFVILTQMGE